MNILQVVGYKNSRKTTITKALISHFSKKGMRVGSLKNHGHGGVPVGIEETDSEQHRKAGALVSGVFGEHIFQLAHTDEWNFEQMLAIYELLKIEVLIVEGFKQQSYPKLVLLRNEDDVSLLTSLENILAVLKPSDLHIEINELPVFDIDNPKKICEWIDFHYVRGGA